jgi:elongation factor 1-gamma
MATGTLYTYPENFRAFKAQIAAQYSGANVKVVSSPPDFKYGETNKTAAFLKKFPTGNVPAFEDSNGVTLFESNAIAQYVANDALRGASALDAAFVRQWMDFADNQILPSSCAWVFPCLGVMQFNKQSTEAAKEAIKAALSILNDHLATRTFLVGERISLADIAVCCNLLQLYQYVLEPAFRQPYQNTNRWFTTLVNQPQFKKVIGDFKFCDKMAVFDAKKFAEVSGKGDKKQDKPKAEKKQEKPKQEPKAKKPEPAAEEPEDEFKEKPSKDPFAAFPKGTFVMDDWKKTYSNTNDTVGVAMPWFWKNFDPENYSIWFCEYKYPEDLKLTFMSANLISGMMQRLDKMRKHAFGSVCLFGSNNNSTISGVWCWRGQDLAFELDANLQIDYESYDWKKLNFNDEGDRKKITEYFAQEGDFDGKKIVEGKVFK